ncbi:MAG: helix-turn-helix transcriptional regulator [Anaerolineae bacterium]|nr:helix-turn-helix transcriptional regulator [Anaerolineae bacterium]
MTLLTNAEDIAAILKTISPPTRLAILLAIGEGEACVCHLEAVLGKRQAYISQHLMALRQSNVLLDRRDGRFVYYRIAEPALLDLVRGAGRLAGVDTAAPVVPAVCECPHCSEQKPGYRKCAATSDNATQNQ